MYPNFPDVMQWLADSSLLEMIVDKLNPSVSLVYKLYQFVVIKLSSDQSVSQRTSLLCDNHRRVHLVIGVSCLGLLEIKEISCPRNLIALSYYNACFSRFCCSS